MEKTISKFQVNILRDLTEFVLLKPPKHGYVENSHFPRLKLMKFTRKQVENKLICYAYDDSEELLDNFTIFANSSELGKQSFPQTLFVTVESVNDEAPIITANKILQVLLLRPQVMVRRGNTEKEEHNKL